MGKTILGSWVLEVTSQTAQHETAFGGTRSQSHASQLQGQRYKSGTLVAHCREGESSSQL